MAQPDVIRRYRFGVGQSDPYKQTMVSKASTKFILGRKLDPSLDRVSMGADPSEEWVHYFTLWNIDTSNQAVYVEGWMTYWIELSDPLIASSV